MKKLFLVFLFTGCSLFDQKTTPETRAQVGDAVAGTGSTLAGAGTATGNPVLLVVGGLLVAAGAAIKGASTPKEPKKDPTA